VSVGCYTLGMQTRNIVALGLFGIFYVVFGVYLTLNQARVVYYPNNQDFYDCPALREASMVVASGTRLYTNVLAGQPTAVLYHGNAGSACDRAVYARLFTAAGYGYVLVEYAGYSNDPLPPSHARIKQDVRHVIDWLAEQGITASDTVVVGESIGTGVAAYHTQLAPPASLVLIAPFTSLVAVARTRFWFYPTTIMVDNAFDNVTALKGYAGRTLIIHGEQDNIIPYALGQQLFDSLESEKTFQTITGAGHNDLFLHTKTYTAISEFLKQP